MPAEAWDCPKLGQEEGGHGSRQRIANAGRGATVKKVELEEQEEHHHGNKNEQDGNDRQDAFRFLRARLHNVEITHRHAPLAQRRHEAIPIAAMYVPSQAYNKQCYTVLRHRV